MPGRPLPTLDQLLIFHEVARQGSFSQAAARLYVSQPSVSLQMQALERHYGCTLFLRQRRGVALTSEGREVQRFTERLLADFDGLAIRLGQLKDGQMGELTIGASLVPGTYVLPEVLKDLRCDRPGIAVQMKATYGGEVLQMLAAAEVDLAVVRMAEGQPLNARFRQEKLLADPLLLVVDSHHPWVTRGASEPVSLAELGSAPFIFSDRASSMRASLTRQLELAGVLLDVHMELANTEAIKRAVAHGLGISLLSSLSVADEVTAGQLAIVPVSDVDLTGSVSLVTRQDQPLDGVGQAFRSTLLRWVERHEDLFSDTLPAERTTA
jgi:LysR family transcriptional regulator, low CO2-responsive transcriptional regulator